MINLSSAVLFEKQLTKTTFKIDTATYANLQPLQPGSECVMTDFECACLDLEFWGGRCGSWRLWIPVQSGGNLVHCPGDHKINQKYI
jgi:hypothetical protein